MTQPAAVTVHAPDGEVELHRSAVDVPHHDKSDDSTDEQNSKEVVKRNLVLQDPLPLSRQRGWLREYFAEFFGTFFLITLGTGVNATMTFFPGDTLPYQTNSRYLGITLGWGFALCMALFMTMGVSGGHLNPAVTLANCIIGSCPWRKFPGFFLAQMLGAITGAANTYGLFKPHFDKGRLNLKDGETMTSKYGGLFCTYPAVSTGYAAWSELFNTILLMMGILAIVDDRLTPASGFKPLAVGLLVFTIGITTGINTGYAINPARDLGPRMVTAMLWGKEPFTLFNHYFWIPTFMPFIGTILGVLLYTLFIIPPKA